MDTIKFLLYKLFWCFQQLLSDKWYAKFRYWLELDQWPNIDNPKMFTEKIQYIKLYERIPLRKTIADRTTVRSFVAERIGKKHLVPLLDIFDSLSKKKWDTLPQQFILKANHGSGMLKIIRNKSIYSFDEISALTEEWKQTEYFNAGREWAYKGLPRTILAEELLLDSNNHIPKDYKFFCMDGKVELIQVDFDRFGDHKQVFFDRRFNPVRAGLVYPENKISLPKPPNFEKAIELAEVLSKSLTQIRVDLYLMENEIYFGEMTNYPLNGFKMFKPKKLEYQMGQQIHLR